MINNAISLGKRQLVDSIWKSAGIEGLGTTFPDTQCILDNIPTKTTKDEMFFIINMKHAWEFLFENIDYPMDIMYLRELNKICMENLIYEPGRIRDSFVTIGGTSWAPEIPNTAAIIEDIRKILENPDKREAALDMFCYIARTQMFLDGNKRVSQLACNKVLMEDNIGILSVPYDRIKDFMKMLVNFYETGDSKNLKDFFKQTSLIYTPEYMKDHNISLTLHTQGRQNKNSRTFVMIAGIPGAGKEDLGLKYFEKMDNAVFIRTNNIREEGIANENVISEAKKRIRSALYDEKNIVYVASNLDTSSRKEMFDLTKGIQNLTKKLAVIYKDPAESMSDEPELILRNKAIKLHDNKPDKDEGWDEIIIIGKDPYLNRGLMKEESLDSRDKNDDTPVI